MAEMESGEREAAAAVGVFHQVLRSTRIIQVALPSGVLLFLGVVVYLHFGRAGNQGPASGDGRLLEILSLVHLILFAMAWPLGFLLFLFYTAPSRLLRPGRFLRRSCRPERGPGVAALPDEPLFCFSINFMKATLLRLACLEGPAVLGVVICLLGVTTGILREDPRFWWNCLDGVLFLLVALVTFPTRHRVEAFLAARLEESRASPPSPPA